MPKQIKEYYKFLDLPYNSTTEQIQMKQKVLVKVLRAKELTKNKNYSREIAKVNEYSTKLIDYVNTNGVQKEAHIFAVSLGNLGTMFFWVIIALIFFFANFLSLI